MFDVLIRLFNELEYKKYTAEDLKAVRELLIQLGKEYKNNIQGVRIIQVKEKKL